MTEVIYLLGAGRSGTTMLATVLNSIRGVHTLGEMHQFPEHLLEDRACSCGQPMGKCPFWKRVKAHLHMDQEDVLALSTVSERAERHKNIPMLLLGRGPTRAYSDFQEHIFSACETASGSAYLLDSSKYIARYIMLSKSRGLRVKGIYMVRDVRGVIESFGKNVQTPKKPGPTLLYYALINAFGELVYRLSDKVIKVRYEDFIRDPQTVVSKILNHIDSHGFEDPMLPGEFEMPHIVGGNRMKTMKSVSINPGVGWPSRMGRLKQLTYYLMVWPLMVLNRYGP